MQSSIFYRCLILSGAVHGLAFAIGVGFLIQAPSKATIEAEIYRESLSAEIVSESELINSAPATIQPAPEENLLRTEVPIAGPFPSIQEPTKAPQKKVLRVEQKKPKAQSKVSLTSSETTSKSDPNRPTVEGAAASERGSTPIHASADYHRNPRPEYPESARRGRREGLVRLLVLVDSTGTPTSVTVSVTSGVDALDSSAIAAVKEWRFKPGNINGFAVASQVEVPIRFSLKDERAAKQ